ncbi:hypothetical protein [Meiothermus hypogaeus]|uniref:Uncharacterized protein n=2 Tax=Meiothermus hypogaeus TaxID=884155 RepID=A0A511R3P6_9DEIN|nr:hypothetical protein [Meiothermus hypogaeus]RIH77734.1 hypothetical protein Mhypo_01886 [Meiothermus hypogaeus]GEM83626.1 hypothetical protein MHY01S_17920 [Meiothermus hypogaeus NBRC 106114]GIW36632.1 MAG: hypothetical protein KatS3mg073_0777 [Meiothermus sp.]
MPAFNPERAAAILAEAVTAGDLETCRKYGISPRTLRNYRARLAHDPHLAAFFRSKRQALEGDWVTEVRRSILEGLRFLRLTTQRADPSDPRAVTAIAEALKVMFELEMTREVVTARFEGDYRLN